jgi:leucyl/phenylalanyl-tRNA--protein transferase
MGEGEGIAFYTADPRSILPLDGCRFPRRLLRTVRQGRFEIRINGAFSQVIRGCARRSSTWINRPVIEIYEELHRRGAAHSVEAWQGGRLAGGLYGVALGGAFFGESMFYEVPDASKVCLVHLVERLRERGYVLLDCQQQTANLARFGAILIPACDYLDRLRQALQLEHVRFLG